MTAPPPMDDAASGVSELDGSACADALTSSQAALVEAERSQVVLIAQWCDLHSGLVGRRTSRQGRALPGAERSLVIGGDGTPAVREFAAAELGVLLGVTTTGAASMMRDVLGLRHRHPKLYSRVCAGQARFFQARHVARATVIAGLTLAQARFVDDRVAPYLGTVSWGRIMALVEAAIIEADPEAAEQRRITAEMARFVRTGRSNEFGTTMIYARARAGDAVFFLAMCDRIAQILKLRRSLEVAGHADRCPQDPHSPDARVEMDVLRSEAVGILANPVKALALLQWAETHAADPTDSAEPSTDSTAVTVPAEPEYEGQDNDRKTAEPGHEPALARAADGGRAEGPQADVRGRGPRTEPPRTEPPKTEPPRTEPPGGPPHPAPPGWPDPSWHPREPEPHDAEPEPESPGHHRCPPVVVLDDSVNPEAFRPRAVLYVHVSQESFRAQTRGAARVEGVGPITIEQAVDFLRNSHVTVRPVIDLNDNPSADGYEVSPLVRETVILRQPVEPFPWGTLSSRGADADHIEPYRDPPAAASSPGAAPKPQTNADNLQPLGRLHHRLKTHGGWQCTSPEPGVHLWRSPHGHWTRVDSTGTTYLGRIEGAPEVSQVIGAHLSLLAGRPA